MAVLMPEGKQSFTDSAGVPLVGGKLFTYDAGTSNPRPTYVNAGGISQNTNPIILDGRGEAVIFWSGSYKVVLTDAAGATIWTIDNIVSTDTAAPVNNLISTLASSAGATMIGWIQSGIGAVLRTVASKLQERVSVWDFMTSAQIADTQLVSPVLDLTTPLNTAISSGKKLYWPQGRYRANVTIPNTERFDWIGDGAKKTILVGFSTASPTVTNNFQDPDWCYSHISDMSIYQNNPYVGAGAPSLPAYTGIGFCMGSPLGYPAGYVTGAELIGRVVFTRVDFRGCHMGVYKPYGNIGNAFYACTWQWHDYGYYAKGVPSLTHAGDDYFDPECQVNACEIAGLIALDATPGTGDWKVNGKIQFNRGFGTFFDFGVGNAFRPIQLNYWDEANGTSYTPGPVATVTIDTLAGPAALAPNGKTVRGLRDTLVWGVAGLSNGIGTTNPQAPLGIWGNQRSAINLIGGGFLPNWTQLGFSSEGSESTLGAGLRSDLTTGTSRSITAIAGSANIWQAQPTGQMLIGADAISFFAAPANTHAIYGPNVGAGQLILTIGSRFGSPTTVYDADAAGFNAATAVMKIGRINSNSRSINAGGTINASGADYAEYMLKADGCNAIPKGAIVGINVQGLLTDNLSQAIAFMVKSTNPSYVGGDDWFTEELPPLVLPDPPVQPEPVQPSPSEREEIKTSEAAAAAWDARRAAFKASMEAFHQETIAHEREVARLRAEHDAARVALEQRLEAARQRVDRIAFAGQVPVNVWGAQPGDYIVPVPDADGGITAIPVTSPTFDQYRQSVGRVIAIEADGRARIIVKVS